MNSKRNVKTAALALTLLLGGSAALVAQAGVGSTSEVASVQAQAGQGIKLDFYRTDPNQSAASSPSPALTLDINAPDRAYRINDLVTTGAGGAGSSSTGTATGSGQSGTTVGTTPSFQDLRFVRVSLTRGGAAVTETRVYAVQVDSSNQIVIVTGAGNRTLAEFLRDRGLTVEADGTARLGTGTLNLTAASTVATPGTATGTATGTTTGTTTGTATGTR